MLYDALTQTLIDVCGPRWSRTVSNGEKNIRQCFMENERERERERERAACGFGGMYEVRGSNPNQVDGTEVGMLQAHATTRC